MQRSAFCREAACAGRLNADVFARLSLLPLLALLLLAAVPLQASAAGNCGTEVLTTALKGPVNAWYSPGCYKRAVKLETPDMKAYSDIGAVISTATRRDRLRKLKIAIPTKAPGSKVTVKFTPGSARSASRSSRRRTAASCSQRSAP